MLAFTQRKKLTLFDFCRLISVMAVLAAGGITMPFLRKFCLAGISFFGMLGIHYGMLMIQIMLRLRFKYNIEIISSYHHYTIDLNEKANFTRNHTF